MGVESTSIKSILRVRPPHKDKRLRVKDRAVYVDKNDQEELSFLFDAAYKSNSTQEDIYHDIEAYLDNIARGINTSILAYGATGSGKTYTMCGSSENPGIIPRIAADLFGRYTETLSVLFKVQIEMSYIEIYNEKVYDLLAEEPVSLPVREDSHGKVVIQGVLEEKVRNKNDFESLFKKGGQRRKQRKTLLNTESSRSHAIVTLFVTLSTESTMVRTKINLVDLAGSENNKRTGNEGMSMVESASINRSLFVLNKVIESLGKGNARIPYRDSKLTRILQDSLGGLSDCALIVNIQGDSSAETVSTLAFSGKSRKVKLKPQSEKIAFNKWTSIVKEKTLSQSRLPTRGYSGDGTFPGGKRIKGSMPLGFNRSYENHDSNNNNTERREEKKTSKKSTLSHNKNEPKEKKRTAKHCKKQSIEIVLEIVNSGDFLRIKSLPMIGDQRAEKIIKYAQKKPITDINELLLAGITKKILANLVF
ncbi:kinesin family member 22 [Nematocida parisii]|nr:kinesin family member 22 [Nematocida parisii]KAI5128591.1 kinesin family member 22 [Nematocida parisii]KAI5141888.1 kinesin family member 22 [Nematocida parisii]